MIAIKLKILKATFLGKNNVVNLLKAGFPKKFFLNENLDSGKLKLLLDNTQAAE